jgi:hypothetical protein
MELKPPRYQVGVKEQESEGPDQTPEVAVIRVVEHHLL